jgi:hypothetical protein
MHKVMTHAVKVIVRLISYHARGCAHRERVQGGGTIYTLLDEFEITLKEKRREGGREGRRHMKEGRKGTYEGREERRMEGRWRKGRTEGGKEADLLYAAAKCWICVRAKRDLNSGQGIT